MPIAEHEPAILRVVMAGSVDDGKSTLIGRLLYDARALLEDQVAGLRRSGSDSGHALDFSLATDGLRAERDQGITIDVAYRYLSTPAGRIVLADAPGHEQYTRNMATAASRADVAVLLIDALAGLTRQSRRHAFICAAFGIPSCIVAVNKMDLVGFDRARFDEVARDYANLAARLNLADVRFVPVCALTGENVVATGTQMPWYHGPSVLSCLDSVRVSQPRPLLDLRVVVQGVLQSGQARRAYAGRILSGMLRPGDQVVVMPGAVATRVETIAVGAEALPLGVAGRSVTVTMADPVDVGPGSVLVRLDGVPAVRHLVDAVVVWAGKEPLVPGTTYEFRHATGWSRGVCTDVILTDPETLCQSGTDRLVENDVGRARFALDAPLLADTYRQNRDFGSLVVVSTETRETLGAALIVDTLDTETHAKAPNGVSPETTSAGTKVTSRERAALLRQVPMTVWLTGLSGSGKSTIAGALERRLVDAGHAAFVLDGDSLRLGLCRDLGFSPRDRAENIRRVAEVARLMNDAGVLVIGALISPYRKDRASAREIIGPDRFLEVHVCTPLEVCEQRDPKGMYRRARANQIAGFTGVGAPYEAPEQPDLALDTQHLSVEECVQRLVRLIEARGRD